ncbi:M4 family metallopeptidase [Companilactobacillus metriopterae]|uniref:M4 family metallopeptidase n=1 Tax=Companilactobacillus metriopterae TaxID=1909267 RepID=UPI00100ABE9B|nr:M4 family metallopeptidase [Companilactobacillus metriopterae]
MKKNFLVSIFATLLLIGGIGTTTVKATSALNEGDIPLVEPSKLNKVKNNNVTKDLPDGITENDVVGVIGTGKDMYGNDVQLNLSKDLFGNYYFDDQTNNTRIQVSNYKNMGSLYTKDNQVSLIFQLFGVSDAYPDLNDSNKKRGLVISKSTTVNDPSAVELYKKAKESLKYYKDTFNYKGTHNNGKKNRLALVVDASNENNWFNAQMVPSVVDEGTAIITGIGGETSEQTSSSGEKWIGYGENFAKSETTVAHEYAHIIAKNLMNDNASNNEVSAGKEAIADMFAASQTRKWNVMDGTHTNKENWEIGRDLADPSSHIDAFSGLPFPDKYSDLANANYDPHNMGTVVGKAYYLLTEGEKFNGYDVKGIGFKNSEQLLYKAVSYLGHEVPYTGFSSIRQAFEKAAADNYPEYIQNIQDAFNATEIPSSSNN